MNKNLLMAAVFTAVISIFMCGCGSDEPTPAGPETASGQAQSAGSSAGKIAVDLQSSIAELTQKAQQMNTDQLMQTAQKYKQAVVEKYDELKGVQAKLEDFSVTDLLSDEAKQVKSEVEEIKSSISSLKDRFKIYYDRLVELKADVSELKLPV
ncbi:hypothetical protein SMSP2_00723 [Limihaloglobus sulfuriphilus]|uniref:Lipoprotein n=1 Tax=Limihaloglobus sulfuriphilus TaxID=1851148 RepID=A0A1Q2MCE8_9BACT|nr:PCRF domain-containing protein [Limihaloglobus sulfuriphilus]AQQ70375.1 hypothetical protein SMSP2_00723 [Limihaloglobus sulfuriphilus]